MKKNYEADRFMLLLKIKNWINENRGVVVAAPQKTLIAEESYWKTSKTMEHIRKQKKSMKTGENLGRENLRKTDETRAKKRYETEKHRKKHKGNSMRNLSK